MAALNRHASAGATAVVEISSRDLSPIFGAEIRGVDLSQPLAPETFKAIERIWLDRQVILFPDQTLGEEDQVRFAELFGALNRSHTIKPHHSKTNNAVMFVSNIVENG